MLKTILIDDERPALKLLEHQLKQYEEIKIVGQYTDIFNAFDKINEEDIQLIFLDIEMPKMNGIEVAEKILSINSNAQIVFVTAYDNYALDAFEVDAIDYIMKPVIKRRLDKTINKVIKKISPVSRLNSMVIENEITCFGNFEWIHKSETIKWRTAKTKELVAFFVQYRGKYVHKDKIIENLWADKNIDKAVKLLHTSIYNIRRTLKTIGIERSILYSDEMYKLNVDNVNCDLYEFEEIVNTKKMINKENIKDFRKAIQLYRGDYFEEDDFVWVRNEQERLSKIYIDILKQISNYYIQQGEYNQAVTYLKTILEKNPYLEEIHNMLLNVYAYLDDYTLLVNHYKDLVNIFSQDLGIEPSSSIKKLYNQLYMKKLQK